MNHLIHRTLSPASHLLHIIHRWLVLNEGTTLTYCWYILYWCLKSIHTSAIRNVRRGRISVTNVMSVVFLTQNVRRSTDQLLRGCSKPLTMSRLQRLNVWKSIHLMQIIKQRWRQAELRWNGRWWLRLQSTCQARWHTANTNTIPPEPPSARLGLCPPCCGRSIRKNLAACADCSTKCCGAVGFFVCFLFLLFLFDATFSS